MEGPPTRLLRGVRLELTLPELTLLDIIYSRSRGVTSAYLAKLAGLSVEEASALLRQLEAKGLVEARGRFWARPRRFRSRVQAARWLERALGQR